jgi:hypothetical protein
LLGKLNPWATEVLHKPSNAGCDSTSERISCGEGENMGVHSFLGSSGLAMQESDAREESDRRAL